MREHCMCLAFKEQFSNVIFRFVIPFANRLANLKLADWLTILQIGQIGRLFGTYLSPFGNAFHASMVKKDPFLSSNITGK